MKRLSLIISLLVLFVAAKAQNGSMKIVFDVTSADVKVHQSAIRHVKAMADSYPEAQLEVVVYSGALDMVLKGKSSVEEDIENLSANDNVTIAVCKGTMRRYNVDSTQIVLGVQRVQDALTEIVGKQNRGWAYIKESN